MSSKTRFYPYACIALALVTASMTSSILCAQTVASSSRQKGTVSPGAKASFLAAPIVMLNDAPSGVVTTDLDGDGKPDLVVASSAAGKIRVSLGRGKGKFATPVDYIVGGHPTAIAAVDVNGDGIRDIVTANGDDGTVSLFLALAGGKLGEARVYPVGVGASFFAAADLNDDGKQDLVIVSKSANALAILLDDGQGGFQKARVQTLGRTPESVVVSDFNGDKHVDAAVAYADGTVGVFLGSGDGSLTSAGSFKASSYGLSAVVAGDFNADGNVDLAVAQEDGRLLSIFLGLGGGSFAKSASYPVGSKVSSVVAIDANGDGVLDLLSVNSGTNTLSVLLGNGDGSFHEAPGVTVGDGPLAVAPANFYGDGFTDLAVVNASTSSINIVAGKGDGTFRAAPSYSGDLSPRAIASGDLNGDGIPDLVVSNYCGSDSNCSTAGSLSVYLGRKAGGYTLSSPQPVGSGPVSVTLADVNGDSILDVLALNRVDKSLSVLLGAGDGTFTAASTSPLVGSPVAVVAKDLDKDGKLDLAIVSDCGSAKCSQRGSVDTYFGQGDGSFRYGSSTPVSYSPSSITAGDLNGDGVLDLVVANACGSDSGCNSVGSATVLLGGSAGIFAAQPEIPLKNGPSSVALRAANGSTKLDLIVAHAADKTVAVLPGNSDGTFNAPALYPVGNSPRSLVVADLNGDGIPDVAVANAKDSTVSVLYGQTDGTLISGDSYAVAAGPEALTAVASAAGKPASLVTANGNISATLPGAEITSLSNLAPSALTGTTTTLTITPASGTVNSAFTLQATVSPAPPDGETVAFSSDVSQFSDCVNPAPLTSGVASCTTSQLTAGQRTLTATYSSDGTFDSSVDNEPQTVNPVSAPLNLSGPAANPMVNQSVTYTATLQAGSGSFTPTVPTGTVSFTITGQAGASCANVLLSAGTVTAQCTFTAVSAGSVSVVASYTNDTNFTVANSSNTISQTVDPVAATLTIAPQTATPTVNQAITYTATLGAGSGSLSPTAPSGTISFVIGGQQNPACTSTMTSATTATCTLTPTAATNVTVTASYSGDANYTVATQPSTTSQTVSPVAATLTISPQTSTPTVNQSITYVATLGAGSGSLSPTAPTGTISFVIGGQQGLSCSSTMTSNTTASCTFIPTAATNVTVTANYSGDANYTVASPPSTPSQSVSPVAATLTITPQTATPLVNKPITYTATLGAGSGSFSPTAPAGLISFTIGGQQGLSCSSTMTSSTTASCTFTPTAATNVTVTANYGGDANYAVASPPSTPNQPVNPVTATLTLTGPSSATTVNQSVSFTATLGAGNSVFAPTAPAGIISFIINGRSLSECPAIALSGTGMSATCTTRSLVAPANSITATYTGDANFVASNPPALPQSVTAIAATTSIAPSPASAVVNQPVTFTATIKGSVEGPVIPKGSVTFTQGSTTLCGGPVTLNDATLTTATAACQTSFPVASATGYTVTATYRPTDTNFTSGVPSTSSMVVVTPGATTTSLAIPSGSLVVDQPVTLKATITQSPAYAGTAPSLPTGTVAFTDQTLTSTTVLCSATQVMSDATATCTSPFLSQGTHTLKASFTPTPPAGAGVANFTGSDSPSISQTVDPAPVSLVVTSSTANAQVNQALTLMATLTRPATGTGATLPNGTLTFSFDDPTLTPCVLTVVNGAVPSTCAPAFSTAATHVITATYTNDSNFTTPPVIFNQVVTSAPTTTQITLSPASPSVDQIVTFTATVSAPTGNVSPQGTISLSDTLNSPLCTITVRNGTGTCNSAFQSQGQRTLSGFFASGDTRFFASTTSSPVIVAKTGTSIQVASGTSVVNQTATLSAVVTSNIPSAGLQPPLGTVTFFQGATQLCNPSVDPATGNASCRVLIGPANRNPYQITAQYAGDGNFTASTATAAQTVTAATTSLAVTAPAAQSVATQSITFTATISSASLPTAQTPAMFSPAGSVAFTVANGGSTVSLGCSAVSVSGAPPFIASCPITFPTGTAMTAYTVSATYTGDSNFTASSTTAAASETVRDFLLSVPTPSPVLVTQGYTSSNDPFNATPVAGAVSAINGFADALTYTCSIAPSASGLSCTLPSGNGTPSFVFAASSSATVGTYTATITATDTAVPMLARTARTIPIQVGGAVSSFNLTSGASGTALVPFPANIAFTSFTCTAKTLDGRTDPTSNFKISCSGPAGTSSGNGVTISIRTGPASTSSLIQTSRNRFVAAACFGLPVFLLAGARRRNWVKRTGALRLLGSLIIVCGLAQIIGCGGGFTLPSVVSTNAAANTYQLDVVGTAGTSGTYHALVILVVN